MKWQYKKRQIILSVVACILWVASIGTIVLGLFTFFVPWIDPGTNTSDVA
jgi:hypothetical protein